MLRQPEGIPTGGQFAVDRKAEPDGALEDFAPADNHESSHSAACEITDLDHTPTADCAYPEDFAIAEPSIVTLTEAQKESLRKTLAVVEEAGEGGSTEDEIDAIVCATDEALSLLNVDIDADDDPVAGEPEHVRELRECLKAVSKAADGDSNDEEFSVRYAALDAALGHLGMKRQ